MKLMAGEAGFSTGVGNKCTFVVSGGRDQSGKRETRGTGKAPKFNLQAPEKPQKSNFNYPLLCDVGAAGSGDAASNQASIYKEMFTGRDARFYVRQDA